MLVGFGKIKSVQEKPWIILWEWSKFSLGSCHEILWHFEIKEALCKVCVLSRVTPYAVIWEACLTALCCVLFWSNSPVWWCLVVVIRRHWYAGSWDCSSCLGVSTGSQCGASRHPLRTLPSSLWRRIPLISMLCLSCWWEDPASSPRARQDACRSLEVGYLYVTSGCANWMYRIWVHIGPLWYTDQFLEIKAIFCSLFKYKQ